MCPLGSLALILLVSMALGSPVAAQYSTIHLVRGKVTDKHVGSAVAAAGDVDRDGHPDFAVTTTATPHGSGTSSRVSIHSGRTGLVLRSYHGEETTGFGATLANLGDLNSDGFPDLAIASPQGATPNAGHGGLVSIYSGKDGQVIQTIHSPLKSGKFGTSIIRTPDLDNDKVRDFAIGAPGHPDSNLPNGVYIYSGATQSLIHTVPGYPGTEFGAAIEHGCDIDKDGLPDLIVGVPNLRNGAIVEFSGKAYTRIRTIDASSPTHPSARRLGAALAHGGDLNGDGYDDYLAGAPGDSSANAMGSVFAYSIQSSTPWKTMGVARKGFGAPISVIGDVDGDKVSDFAVADAPQRVLIYSGKVLGMIKMLVPGVTTAGFGSTLSSADVDLDGRSDVIIGSSESHVVGQDVGAAWVFSIGPLALATNKFDLVVTQKDSQTLAVDFGPGRTGLPYLIVGSASGSWPGTRLGPVRIPLNHDPYTDMTIGLTNIGPFQSFGGVLDRNGRAQGQFQPFQQIWRFGAVTLRHAALAYDAAKGQLITTNAIPVTLHKWKP